MIQLEVNEILRNKKNGHSYRVLNRSVINTTNVNDGQDMVLYTDGSNLFVKEEKEFKEKFE